MATVTNPGINVSRGIVWAYIGAIASGVISVAANVAHSFVPPADAPADWKPEPGAIAGSTFWPVLLLIAVEILARVQWPAGWQWAVLRFGGFTPVALVAAFVSYLHLSGLLLYYGELALVAYSGPIAVDGLMVMATTAVLVISINKHALATQSTTTVTTDTAPAAQSAEHRGSFVQAGDSLPEHLLSTAKALSDAHENRYGQAMMPDQLAAIINVKPELATKLLARLAPPPVNGTALAVRGGAR